MFAKIAVICAVVAVAYAGVIASPPASTTLLANVAPVAIAHHGVQLVHSPIQQIAAVRTIGAHQLVAAPHTIVAAPQTIVATPQVIQTGTKIVQTVEPVEQHGYRIAY